MGFAMMGLEAISPGLAKIAGGLSGMANGLAAVKTGLALFSLGPVGAIAGLICIVVGAATMAVGLNDAVNGATGTNYIREWTGWSEDAYANLSMALNIASTVCTIAGNAARYFRGSRCFIAGTLVACLGIDGKECKKKIEDVEVGDEVLAFDEETGKLAYKKVVKLFRNKSKDWTGVTIGGNEIVSTPGHKYYLPENEVCREVGEKHEHAGYEELSVKWVSACNLKIGDRVLLSNGEYGIVEKVRNIHYDTPQTTYNFEVEGYHTYFVGENSVCVHNMAPCHTPKSHPDEFTKMKGNQGYKDADGNFWKKDMLHKDHWDISNSKGIKVKEVDFSGNQIWPGGPKNTTKKMK